MLQHNKLSSISSNPSGVHNSQRPRSSNNQNFGALQRFSKNQGSNNHTHKRPKKNIDDLMQQLSIKMNEQSNNYNSPYNEANTFKSPDKQEKERQLGIILSQLSKKFPISDVLERKNIQDLDEMLAYQINQRMLPSKSEFSVQNYFTKEGLPHQQPQTMKEYMQSGERANYDMVSPDSFSRNPNLMNTYTSNMNQLNEGAQIMESNNRIFGKLKHRENKLPSTAGEKDKNWRSIVRQRKQPTSIDLHLYLSPSKLQFFKSHYPMIPSQAQLNSNLDRMSTTHKFKNAINNTFQRDQTLVSPGPNQKEDLSLSGNYLDNEILSGVETAHMFRMSNSILRNNKDDAFIMKMANRDSPLKEASKVSASYIFNNPDDEELVNTTKSHNEIKYYHQEAALNNSTFNITVPKAELAVRASQNQSSLHKLGGSAGFGPQVIIRREFRAQSSQNGNRKKLFNDQSATSSAIPLLNDLVKMPKRLQPKKGLDQMNTFNLYNCCPEAAMVDREMENRLSPSTLRKSIFKANKSVEKNTRTLTSSIPEEGQDTLAHTNNMPTRKTLETKKQHSFVIKKLRTTRFQGKKEESIASLPNQPGFINVDPEKVKIARDKIYEIAKIKVESAFNPIRYEYIEADKMTVIDLNKKNKQKNEEDSFASY